MAEASPFYYWGYPYFYHPLKLGPKHEWVEGYGYAIPQAKPAEERKKREATAVPEPEPEPAVLASFSSISGGAKIVQPYAVGDTLLGAVPHSATVEHKGTEVIPGAVSIGVPIASPGFGYAGKKSNQILP